MAFKLCQSAQDRWVRLRGFDRLPDVVNGMVFVEGIAHTQQKKQPMLLTINWPYTAFGHSSANRFMIFTTLPITATSRQPKGLIR